jgi:glutathione S-transferase
MYTLYYSPGAASLAVHLMLLELGVRHRLERVDFDKDAQHSPEYLRLNPRGQVPTLLVDGRPYFESAALLMMLAERHPEAGLAPPPGSELRAAWYQWMMFLASALGPLYRQWFYPADLGTEEHTPVVRDSLRRKIEQAWAFVDDHLQASGPYMLGAKLSAVDLLAIMYMRWSRNMPKPATEWPALRGLADLVRSRPGWARLCDVEGLTEWRR